MLGESKMTPKELINCLRNHPEFWNDFEAILKHYSDSISKKEDSESI